MESFEGYCWIKTESDSFDFKYYYGRDNRGFFACMTGAIFYGSTISEAIMKMKLSAFNVLFIKLSLCSPDRHYYCSI